MRASDFRARIFPFSAFSVAKSVPCRMIRSSIEIPSISVTPHPERHTLFWLLHTHKFLVQVYRLTFDINA